MLLENATQHFTVYRQSLGQLQQLKIICEFTLTIIFVTERCLKWLSTNLSPSPPESLAFSFRLWLWKRFMTSKDVTVFRVSMTSWVAQCGRVKLWILCTSKMVFITRHHTYNHITQHINHNKRGLNGCVSSSLLSQLFLVWREQMLILQVWMSTFNLA